MVCTRQTACAEGSRASTRGSRRAPRNPGKPVTKIVPTAADVTVPGRTGRSPPPRLGRPGPRTPAPATWACFVDDATLFTGHGADWV
ncbi:MAG: hypothetical protein U5R31_02820 [Acidimicrobiia bacterium]|nr:hypothetical protein [Acidimicrobiia bacterium]